MADGGAQSGLWGAMGGVPGDFGAAGGVDPTELADFWRKYNEQLAAAQHQTEVSKNVPAPLAPAPAVTPGPEAFKQNPSSGATDLEGYNLSPDAKTRAITAAMEPVLGGVQLGARAAQGLASGFGYYPNETSAALGKASEAVGETADQFRRAGEEQSKRAGYDPAAVSILHPSTWDPARTVGALASPANLVAGRAGGAVGDALLPARAAIPATATAAGVAASRVLPNAMAKGGGSAVGMGAVQPIEDKAISPNATPGERALQEAENSKNYWTTQLKRAAVNGTIGSLIPAVTSKGGDIVGGIVPDNVRTLVDSYARLTPGQIAGGWMGRLETMMESLPITGWAIRSAKGRGQEDLPYAMSARALQEVGEAPLPRGTTGGALASGTYAGMQRAYNRALEHAEAPMTPAFYNDVAQNMYNAGVGDLPPDMQRSLASFVDRTITNRVQNAGGAPLDGVAIKAIESDLGKQIGKFGKSGEPYNQDMAEVLESIRGTFMRHVQDSSPPGVREQIARANGGYTTFKQMQKALDTHTLAAAEGRMTPSRLAYGVHAGDRSVGNRVWTEHGVKNQDLSDAAQQVMTDRVNNSGTAERLAAMSVLHGLVAGGAGAATAGGSLAADAAGALLYTRPGQAALQYIMTAGGRPGQVRNAIGSAIKDHAPYAATVGLQSDAAKEEIDRRLNGPNPALKQFGDAKDTTKAAQNFFAKGTDIAGAKRALAQMTPAQRAEFSTGYAGDLAKHVMGAKDPRMALNQWTDSPQARQHMVTAMGPNRANQLEAVMRLEGLQGIAPFMGQADNAKKLGATGAIPNYNELLVHAITSGGAATGKKFNEASVRRTAALLSSQDPELYAKGVKQLANSPMMDAMRAYDKQLVKKGLTQPSFLRNDSEKTAGAVPPGAVTPPEGMGPTEWAAMQAAEDRTQPPKPAELPPAPGAMRVPGQEGWYKQDQKTGKYYKWQ
jgi:hypothetical protein